jgi:hypothetical protein
MPGSPSGRDAPFYGIGSRVTSFAYSIAFDALLWLGIPTLIYGGVLLLGTLLVSRRVGKQKAWAFGAPAVGGVLAIALMLGLFAGIGGLIVGEESVTMGDTFIGWGRLLLTFLYLLIVVVSSLVARRLAARAGLDRNKLTAAVAAATFFFVAISSPFSSIVNACQVGHAVLINASVQCER